MGGRFFSSGVFVDEECSIWYLVENFGGSGPGPSAAVTAKKSYAIEE